MNWPPQTEADVLAALDRGDIVESSQLDVKLEVGNTDGQRRGTAKDLASFAIDGGALLIGVREDKANRKFIAEPFDLKDTVERIELIAATLVEPSLPVHPREISSETDGLGYVWVDIPESPDAPHMVDSRYYGRGERTNRKLGDAEVLRLHRARGSELERSRAALDALHNQDPYLSARLSGDPTAEPIADHGHLYLLATPHRHSPDRAEDLLWESQDKLRVFDQASDAALPGMLSNWSSHLSSGSQLVQRSTAISLTNFRENAEHRFMEPYGMEFRIESDGTIGLIYTGFSNSADGDQPGTVQDGTLVGGAWKLLSVARSVAQHVGYTGSWDVALRATHLQGRQSSVLDNGRGFYRRPRPTFDQPDHEQFIRVDQRELENPAAAVRRLTRPLLRAVGSWKVFEEGVPELGALATNAV